MNKIRIVIVDDHFLVRTGLATIINDQPDMEVVGEADTAADAVRQVERLLPDVVLMDIRLPGQSGIEATAEIAKKNSTSKVVMLTSYADDKMIFQAIRAGAVGYVLKQVDERELLRAIRLTAQGEAVTDPRVTSKLVAHVRQMEHQRLQNAFRDLSERELEVLQLVSRGKTNAEIAGLLNLSERTVGNYISTILQKLQLTNRIELAVYAVEHHLDEYLSRE